MTHPEASPADPNASSPSGAHTTAGRRQPATQLVRHIRTDSTLRREADTMGFYVCVTLFAAMAVGDDVAVQRTSDLMALIWLSTVGLALAHWFAATIATQLVPDVPEHRPIAEVLMAHLLIASIAATSTSLVVLAAPNDVKLLAGRLCAGALLALLVAVEARRGGSSRARGIRLAVLSFTCAAGIAILKRLIF